IELELLADSRDLDLSRREADVALRLAPYTQPGVVARRLARVGFGVYASADYLDRHGRPDFAAGAPGQYTVLPSDELRQAPEMQWFAARTHAARPGLRCNRRQAALAAIEAGMGIGCLARYLGDGRGLVRLDAGPPPPARALWYGVHEDIRHTARIRALAAALAEGFAAAAMRLDPPD
ncbi:MAG TPA: LysR substrate-binding domain-containing protein, partial [Plasticicumulans sp.]